MALEATHVRFALALLSRLNISDPVAYCSGAVYPDTRHTTGLDRQKTHGVESPHNPFAEGLTDFERGWATHLLYDELEGAAMRALIPSHLGTVEESRVAWIEMTAMKIVEDMISVRALGADISYLHDLRIETSPRGEELRHIEKFVDLTTTLYNTHCDLRDYMIWARSIGASDDVVTALQQRTAGILVDEDFRKKIEMIFTSSLDLVCKEDKSQ